MSPKREVKNVRLWLRGLIERILTEDIADDGWGYIDLAMEITRREKQSWWENLMLGTQAKMVRRECDHLRKSQDFQMDKIAGIPRVRKVRMSPREKHLEYPKAWQAAGQDGDNSYEVL